jgi:hypothetical protein
MRTIPLSHWTAGPFLVACALLVYSGATKVVRPAATRPAARALGLPSSAVAVFALAIAEVAVGITGVAFGAVAALGVSVVYALLAIAVARLLRAAPSTPCGCLGSATATASRAHVIVNAVAAAVALVAVTQGPPLDSFTAGPVAAIALGVLVAVAVGLVQLVMDALPELERLARTNTSDIAGRT